MTLGSEYSVMPPNVPSVASRKEIIIQFLNNMNTIKTILKLKKKKTLTSVAENKVKAKTQCCPGEVQARVPRDDNSGNKH